MASNAKECDERNRLIKEVRYITTVTDNTMYSEESYTVAEMLNNFHLLS